MFTEQEKEIRQRLYEKTRNELNVQARSNSETYDRALLTLSSAFLGGSLAVIKQIVDLEEAYNIWMLYIAWSGLVIVIVLTIISFIIGNVLIRQLREAAEKYYKYDDKDAYKVSERNSRCISGMNNLNGIVFVTSILLLAMFVGGNIMGNRGKDAPVENATEVIKRSQPVNEFEKVPATSGQSGSGAAHEGGSDGGGEQQSEASEKD